MRNAQTIGNAYFARVMHVEHLGASRLAIINNWWHMPRTKAVFGHVFQVPPFAQDSRPYDIAWFEVGDGLKQEVLKLRLDKENATLSRFLPGGHWQAETSTLPELHQWCAACPSLSACAVQPVRSFLQRILFGFLAYS